EPTGYAGAKAAVGVEEKPAAGAAFFAVGKFIGESDHGLALSSLLGTQKSDDLAAQFHDAFQRRHGHAHDFFKQAAHSGEKFEHGLEALGSLRVAVRIGFGFFHTFGENAHGRIDFALFSLCCDDSEDFPDVFERFEMVAAIAEYMDH